MKNIRDYNRQAWDAQSNPWTVPVGPEKIAAARQGQWEIKLTEGEPVPRAWLEPLAGRDVLCLASGGGQQGPLLAAAGATVTVLDNSPAQLARDREVAEREGLALATVEGDMAALTMFAPESFDLIVHPVSNLFVPDVRPVWREAWRVLRPGGALLSGFTNPAVYLFDRALEERGVLQVRYPLPYSDLSDMTPEERERFNGPNPPLEWSHSLADQIGGQIDAGFVLAGFYEDRHKELELAKFTPTYLVTRALKVSLGV